MEGEIDRQVQPSIYQANCVPTLTSGSRSASPLHREEPAQVVLASGQDTSWTSPMGGILGMPI